MSAKKGFSKKELADQNAKVADLAKEESKLASAIERGERTLAENREKLKDTQRARASENAILEQMIQRGIKAASKGDTGKRAALIAALLMSDDEDDGEADDGKQEEGKEGGDKGETPKSATPTPAPAPAPATPPATPSFPASGSPQGDDNSQNEVA